MPASKSPLDAKVGVDSAAPLTSSRGLGSALRRGWLGYQRRLDDAMADAGFEDRRFPDGRVLRLCSNPKGSTISAIGRELSITRQGASKVVAHLRNRGYVSVADSATSGREKSVTLTSCGSEYLAAQRTTARKIEAELVAELGETAFTALHELLDALGQGEETRMRTYMQRSSAEVSSTDGDIEPTDHDHQ